MIVPTTGTSDYSRLKIAKQPPLSGCAIIMILLIRNPMKINVGNETRRITFRIGGNHATCVEALTSRRTEGLLNIERLFVREVCPSHKEALLPPEWLIDMAIVTGL